MTPSLAATPARRRIAAAEPVEFLELHSSTLAIKRQGAGTPVVCLHAVGHGSGDFEAIAQDLRDDFEIIAIDWPGQGRSPSDGGPVSAEHYSRLLISVCDALGLNKPIVLGNSIGGAAAAIAAARYADRFSAVVLCNAGGFAALDRLSLFVIDNMAAFFAAGARHASWFPRAFALYYRTCVLTGAPAAAQRTAISAAAYELAPLLAEAWRGFANENADIRALVPRITVPVWLAWAKHDQFVSWKRAKPALSGLVHSRTTLFSASHTPFLEAPEAFTIGFRHFAREALAGAI